MVENNSFKNQKLEHRLTEPDLEGSIDNIIGTSGNAAAVNDNVNQSNVSTLDVHNSGDRKSCAHTKTTLSAD